MIAKVIFCPHCGNEKGMRHRVGCPNRKTSKVKRCRDCNGTNGKHYEHCPIVPRSKRGSTRPEGSGKRR